MGCYPTSLFRRGGVSVTEEVVQESLVVENVSEVGEMHQGISGFLKLWSIIRPSAVPLTPYESESIHNTKSFYRDYSVYPREKDVMLASFHGGNIPKNLFSSKYPGHQNMAITLAAIAKTVMEDITDWRPNTLDSIIIIGSKLHQTKIAQRQMFNYAFTLEIRHLPTTLANNGKEICDVTYGNPVYGILKASIITSDGKYVKSLNRVLSDCFLSQIQGVILKIQGFCMGIMRNKIGHWYVFDSYPKDIEGRYTRFGNASLIKFCRCRMLTHYIENEFIWALPFTAVPVQITNRISFLKLFDSSVIK